MRPSDGQDAATAAFFAGRCDVLSADASLLLSVASDHSPGELAILPELISKEPLAPVVRAQDTALLQVLRWTIYAMIDATERDITSTAGADDSAPSCRRYPRRRSLAFGRLDRNVVREVGSYGEIYARHFERPDGVRLARGLNAPWNQGGLLYAPPLR